LNSSRPFHWVLKRSQRAHFLPRRRTSGALGEKENGREEEKGIHFSLQNTNRKKKINAGHRWNRAAALKTSLSRGVAVLKKRKKKQESQKKNG